MQINSTGFQTSTSLPKGVQFQTVKPLGVFQEFRDYIVTPIQTYSNTFSQSDIVRIQFTIPDWYIDPYESYIEAEVGLQDETPFIPSVSNKYFTQQNVPKFYMMDGPSTSLINDFRLEVNSREIERIREYDQVGNLLTDLNVYPDVVDQKDFEGYYSVKGQPTFNNPDYPKQYNQSVMNNPSGNSAIWSTYQLCNSPFQSQAVNNQTTSSQLNTNLKPQLGTTISAMGVSAVAVYRPANDIYKNQNIAQSVQNTLAEAAAIPLDNQSVGLLASKHSYNAPDAVGNWTIPQCLVFPNSTTDNSYGNTFQMYGPQTLLGKYTVNNSNFGIFSDNNISQAIFNQCQYSPKLNQIDGHNIFLTNLNTSKIQSGQFVEDFVLYSNNTNGQYIQSRAYMQIPLLSGVLGVLIPQDRWQLIPTNSLGQCNMEFRFNENAFFSHDGTQPQWKINKFQLRLRMYKFDQNLQQQLRQTVQNGIQLHSQIFSMGPIYSIQPNTSVTNNWQLNNGIPSIKQLFFWFLAADYELYPHCRKNYKISHNITSMQLKLGSSYIPQQPIIGHAGNIVRNQINREDNSVFLSELQQSVNVLFDCKRHININKLNFAINERPYDITFQTLYGLQAGTADQTGTLSKKGAIGSTVLQQAKDYGYALYNEMRCRGKAVYAFNLEMDKKNDETITGVNTTKLRPIELILKSDDPITFKRQSTMIVMYLSDFIVTFQGNETTTEGAG